jgi:DNA-directed RNA polymerase specialized sigma subunit
MEEQQMLNKLKQVQEVIDAKTEELQSIHEHRKNVVNFCYSNGVSAIAIARTLQCSRQRVYKLIEDKEEVNA